MKTLLLPLLVSLLWLANLVTAAAAPFSTNANRLAYLDEENPFYPHRDFPKLITPQWIGEPGVEAVVILAIDDMRDAKKYENFLRPILDRLKKIDGRAPVSIFANLVTTNDTAQLQTWLAEGLSSKSTRSRTRARCCRKVRSPKRGTPFTAASICSVKSPATSPSPSACPAATR